jgi:type I thyroxine 5'-deiodinase
MVYIREAHPSDGRQVLANRKEGILFPQPRSLVERSGVAAECCRRLDLSLPVLVDGMDNKVSLAYDAWPDRLYLIDKQGLVVYKSAPGPRGFLPEQLAAAARKLVGRRLRGAGSTPPAPSSRAGVGSQR